MSEILAEEDAKRILYVDAPNGVVSNLSAWRTLCCEAKADGFNAVLTPPLWIGQSGTTQDPDYFAFGGGHDESMSHVLGELAAVCSETDLHLYTDVVLDRVGRDSVLASEHADWFDEPELPLDPRVIRPRGLRYAHLRQGRINKALLADWVARLSQWCSVGVAGFRCQALTGLGPGDWGQLIAEVRSASQEARFLAWTPGLAAEQLLPLREASFDHTFLSLPWWNCRDGWLAEEHARLRAVAPVLSPVLEQGAGGPALNLQHLEAIWQRQLWMAAIAGDGILISHRVAQAAEQPALRAVNDWVASGRCVDAALLVTLGPLSESSSLFRGGAGLVLNPSNAMAVPLDWSLVQARLPDSYADVLYPCEAPDYLDPAGFQRYTARRATPVCPPVASASQKRQLGLGLMNDARIAIEKVQPTVDEGRFAAKASLGAPVVIEADVFMDGHDQLAVRLAWRAADETAWHETVMTAIGNDRWRGAFTPTRLGRYMFRITAWLDVWKSYCAGLQKRRDAGQDIDLDLKEGLLMVAEAARCAGPDAPAAAAHLQSVLEAGSAEVLLSERTEQAMAVADTRPFQTPENGVHTLMVERREASFSAWYELFPRSQSVVKGKHGTFSDVRRRLPAIRDMGFNVLYFPPIHPIGTTNRKGRNNALSAQPEDPGSPYAIGSAEGGHESIHPELGTLGDFLELLEEARAHGLELALDFAIQCSPDHPWLTEHSSWFNWRADGSLRFAENPPKRYEDIVNPDFYQGALQPKARASLWRALRDAVLYWIEQGVRIFRVDNPHTKPLPFWEWMLGEIHARHPDVIFLSEAFTRPKMMYRLAKLGFSQSYTYFTWRNDKRELTSYLEELVSPPASLLFRPNFFVNTPDINPYFLQTSGRAGFLIRAALAALLSGSWGMYNGFELCEANALPGREEYLDSEKYELRTWDWNRPGNIVAEISELNRIRKANPALHTHLGLRFHPAHDDAVLFFSKATTEADNIVLVAISLDPHEVRSASIELPLWLWGLPDHAAVQFEDACTNTMFELRGKHHEVRLTPERPYIIWRVRGLQ
ncbi:MAG TPA: alpha-1,4-glucan--maltose-1-phosphate maltosyltransferase [Pusillimonas sp.]|uniref:alpha-1,4-glucan--maltose-1-phosphate maltosyltransferase n=1 Tax=Pusillimonas sp. TaxID=3040095 RepID=UPI002CA13068|nr:alpha-1,4-glucan--maltose-1-phosphate maltosyltransferase [Pusillimonas sp.]HUH86648.1 alpha-1,4-glucan--maltose-1-phosphate maltosyltransferase [Pusillimonas sp.]